MAWELPQMRGVKIQLKPAGCPELRRAALVGWERGETKAAGGRPGVRIGGAEDCKKGMVWIKRLLCKTDKPGVDGCFAAISVIGGPEPASCLESGWSHRDTVQKGLS